jgi:hypothetical protein
LFSVANEVSSVTAVRPSLSILPLPLSLPLPLPNTNTKLPVRVSRFSRPSIGTIGSKRTLSPPPPPPPPSSLTSISSILPPPLPLPVPSPLLPPLHSSLSTTTGTNDIALSSSKKTDVSTLPPSTEGLSTSSAAATSASASSSSCIFPTAQDSAISSVQVVAADSVSLIESHSSGSVRECSSGAVKERSLGIEDSSVQHIGVHVGKTVETENRENLVQFHERVLRFSSDIISCQDNEIRRRKHDIAMKDCGDGVRGGSGCYSNSSGTNTHLMASTSTSWPSLSSTTISTTTAEQGEIKTEREDITPVLPITDQNKDESGRKRKVDVKKPCRTRLNAAQHFKKRGSMSPLQRCCDILCLVWPVVLVLSVSDSNSNSSSASSDSSNNSDRHVADYGSVISTVVGGGSAGDRGQGQGQGQGQGNIPSTQSTQNYSYSYSATSSYAVSSSYSAIPSSSSSSSSKSTTLPPSTKNTSTSTSTPSSSLSHERHYRVTDGWWWCNAVLDPELQRLVGKVSQHRLCIVISTVCALLHALHLVRNCFPSFLFIFQKHYLFFVLYFACSIYFK